MAEKERQRVAEMLFKEGQVCVMCMFEPNPYPYTLIHPTLQADYDAKVSTSNPNPNPNPTLQADYDAKVDKKHCPGCGGKQSYAEVCPAVTLTISLAITLTTSRRLNGHNPNTVILSFPTPLS